MNTTSSTIVQRLWKSCNILRDERWQVSARAVPFGDDIEFAMEAGLKRGVESAVEAGLKRAGRLRQAVPCGDDMLRSALEEGCDIIVLRYAVR